MFNIKVPFVIATHIKKFSALASLKNKNKAAAVALVNKNVFFHDGSNVQTIGSPAPVAVTGNTTLSQINHDGRALILNAVAGATFTLPAATGSGARYFVIIGTTLTSGSFVLQVANANDFMRGQASTVGSSGITVAVTANTGTVASESDTVTWNRTTTGLGTIGDYIEAWDIAANVWSIDAIYSTAGQAAATPFSAAV